MTISSPQSGSLVRGNVIIYGSAQTGDFVSYGLEIGVGHNPDNWISLGPVLDRSVAAGPLAAFDEKVRSLRAHHRARRVCTGETGAG